MKNNVWILLCLAGLMGACQKQVTTQLPESYLDYFDEKQILGITASGNSVWVLSSTVCDTCKVPPHVSYIPFNYQLTKISNNTYKTDEKTPVWKPVKDNNGNMFAKGKDSKNIYRINDIGSYSLLVESGGFIINDFAFDKNNNIWIWGNSGIGYWDGNQLRIFNSSNSIIASSVTHGLAIDSKGSVWVPMDFDGKGVIKISNGNWSIVPITSISNLTEHEYLSRPVADNEGNVWLHTFAPNNYPKIIKYDGKAWTGEFSENQVAIIGKDQNGTIWKTVNSSTDFQVPTSLYYLKNGEWLKFDTRGSKGYIYNVDVANDSVYMGTSRGLMVKLWK